MMEIESNYDVRKMRYDLNGYITDRELEQACNSIIIGHLIADKIATAIAEQLIPKVEEALRKEQG